MNYEIAVKQLFAKADVKIGGKRPGDMIVHNPKTYQRILAEGSLGLGESYMDGWWDCDNIDVMFTKILNANIDDEVKGSWTYISEGIKAKLFNLQKRSRAFQVGEAHYDVGNELYKLMLDKRMVYTCGYWKGLKLEDKNLEKAQEQKLDLVCKKVDLKKGMTVLDIGCGWGSFAKFAAQKYGAKVVGVTISKEQVKLARENCKGLPVEIRLQDYRQVTEKFDRIISLGMFEHVGHKNYRDYMKVVSNSLKSGGLFLLHTIGDKSSKSTLDPWLNKYIFPNGELPSVAKVTASAEGLLKLEDFHEFGKYYDPTCTFWGDRVVKNWDKIQKATTDAGSPPYTKRFYRMWTYWLYMSAARFRSRPLLFQFVFSKDRKELYQTVR